jgi:beta-glucanase (GH16 family)
MDGSGITAKAPCYFECRFLAQSVPGAWPAFWIMTSNAIKGMGEPVDELDVIEGYGGNGARQPNMKGYMVTSHFWHQPEANDPAKGINKNIPVATLGGKSTIWDTFHTYGCKITETDTIYYFDNIEVGRHPTGKASKSIPFFFFINLAVGGNGWPVDLSRYGGVSDMYVDYVRVYQGK